MSLRFISVLFWISALYDGVLGLLFLFLWPAMFRTFGVTPPNHAGYVQFPALLLLIFATLFAQIARDPRRNRSLIGYGIALKIAYSGIVFTYALTTGVPMMWIWCAWIDLAFLVLFIVAYQSLAERAGKRLRIEGLGNR